MIDANSASGVGGLLIGITGIVLTVFYARKAEQLNKMRKRLDWSDLQAAASDLSQRIKSDFNPAAIITPGLTGATFANLLVTEFPGQPPVYVGTRTWKESAHSPKSESDSFLIETQKWIVTIPNSISEIREGDLLIVDDFAMSGDFLELLRSKLEEAGIEKGRIHSCSLAVTKVAIKNHKSPDYYWWVADDDDFFFPWGKAR
ncbi:phosphoribosyltransferase family protein [Streptomyces sp. NPDC086082]|uniref:phosphoribosyltransferase family protein n=1 Tax=Streptomyces sp. NPDC086082 TaxID=3365750 RepID=UPI0038279A58